MIAYAENAKVSTKKLLELINKVGNIVGYKINIQKSVPFFYTNNEISEREDLKKKNKILFKITWKDEIKYLKTKFTKKMKDLYAENYKTLIKETEDDSRISFHFLESSSVSFINVL